MQHESPRRLVTLLLITAVFTMGGVSTVAATTSSSPSYQVVESEFGSGSTLESCSGQYCAKASIGDLAAGKSSNGTTTAAFGPAPTLDSDPLVEVVVNEGVSDLGVLSTERTATKTTSVQVRTHLTDGYILQIIGDPPKYGGHTLATPSTPTESRPGSEQFAINVAANTTPQLGANPVQVPSDQTSFGIVDDKYKVPNLFMFKSGDVIARSDTESGRTDYTISMIVNVAGSTPAGHFAGDFAAVVIPIF